MRLLESAPRRRVSRRQNAVELGPRAEFVVFCSVAIGTPFQDPDVPYGGGGGASEGVRGDPGPDRSAATCPGDRLSEREGGRGATMRRQAGRGRHVPRSGIGRWRGDRR